MVIFRENSEDIYAGVEVEAGSPEAEKVIKFLTEEMGVKKIRFTENCGIGIKPVSLEGTKRLVRKALQYAVDNDRGSVTFVHKGNIMKFTEGAFRSGATKSLATSSALSCSMVGPGCSSRTPIPARTSWSGRHRRRHAAADSAASGRNTMSSPRSA